MHPGVILESSWIHSGVTLDSSKIYPGIILESSWIHPGFILESSWSHPERTLETSKYSQWHDLHSNSPSNSPHHDEVPCSVDVVGAFTNKHPEHYEELGESHVSEQLRQGRQPLHQLDVPGRFRLLLGLLIRMCVRSGPRMQPWGAQECRSW